MQGLPNDAVFIPEGQALTWSPLAPMPAFSRQQKGWQLVGGLPLHCLRATTAQGQPVCVQADDQGRVYYRPQWTAHTALIDAPSLPDRARAARDLAQLDPCAKAPELGFSHPLALHMLLGQAPDAQGGTSHWSEDLPWAAYYKHLPKEARGRLDDVDADGWGLLEIALRRRQFRQAEDLWLAGCRFRQRLLDNGSTLWLLAAGLYKDTPDTDAFHAYWEKLAKKDRQFFQAVVQEEVALAPGRLGEEVISSGLGTSQAHLLLLQRWLRRVVEAGVEPNTTLPLSKEGAGQCTALVVALANPPEKSVFRPEWTQVWVEAMARAGYRFSQPLDCVSTLFGREGTALEDCLEALHTPAVLLARVRRLALEESMGQTKPAARRRM